MTCDPRHIRIDDYDYTLPEERIARYPVPGRDGSKLLVYRQGEVFHRPFTDLPELLPADSLMVFNNTKVIQARLHFRKDTGALIEIFCLEPHLPREYQQNFDSRGQCEVGALHDVTAVAAGAYHTLALHRDGTVSAVGRNDEQQCDTSSWRDVTAIAASDYASFALTKDGTLLCTGFYDYREPESWSGLAAVSGGSYNLAALRSDGSVWTYPKLKNTEALRGCVSLAVNTGYAVGVMPDGSAVSSVFDLSVWRDVLAVSASGTAILGLDLQGRVLAHFFRAGDAVDFSSFTGVKAIAAGGTHFALVLSDGSVKVLGENDHGEADVGDWDLF